VEARGFSVAVSEDFLATSPRSAKTTYTGIRLNAIAAGTEHLIVVIDSCYSGGMVKQIDSGKAGAGKIKAIPWGSLWLGHGSGGASATGRASKAKGPFIDPANPSKNVHAPPGRHDVVFISSSNQYQPSRTGEKYTQFPNRYVPHSAVEANRERAIPYPRGLVIQLPVGKETYNLYWRDKRHDPFEAFPIGLCGDQMPVGRLDDLVRRLEGRGIRKDVTKPPRRGRAGHGDQTRWRDGDGQKTGRRDEARALDPRRGRRAKCPLNEGGPTGTPPNVSN